MDCDGSLDPGDLPAVAGPVASGSRDLVLGARDAEPGAWPPHARVGNRLIAWEVRPPYRCAAHRSRTDAGRSSRSAARPGYPDRRFGWPFEMVLRAHAAGWNIAEVDVPYRARTGRSKVTGTIQGTVRAFGDLAQGDAVNVLVIAKAPVPGRSKTRLCPPCTPEQAARVAEAALGDTLAAVLATPGIRPVLALDGAPGPWLPPGFDVVPQRGVGLDERLACAFEDAGGASFLVGMDTPQLTPHDADRCGRAAPRARRRRRARAGRRRRMVGDRVVTPRSPCVLGGAHEYPADPERTANAAGPSRVGG